MAKVSVVITVLNEEIVIGKLLKSLFVQKRIPDEIVIIDAGSVDKTVQIVRTFQKQYKLLRLLVVPGVNRSEGRNIGIERAQGPIIAVTDAGCIPKKDWLKKLITPFKDRSVDVVSGYYLPQGDSIIQKCLATYTCVLPYRLNVTTFLPASRSLAFRKSIWKKVNGFPKHLDTCEDRMFVQRLMKRDAKFVMAKDAIVYWRQHHTLSRAFKQLYTYAKGDGQARYFPHLKKAALVWIRYLVSIWLFFVFPVILFFLIPQYLAWVIGKGYPFVKDKRAVILLPLLQIIADFAVMAGSLTGLVYSLRSYKR